MNFKTKAKLWIDANLHDGEDRSGCVADRICFNPDDLQELIDDLIDDVFIEEIEQRDAVIDGFEITKIGDKEVVSVPNFEAFKKALSQLKKAK
jgi:hypothetical protein